jgi:hypothetical protein
MRERRPAPLWVVVVVAAALALLVRAIDGALLSGPTCSVHDAPPALAFWGFVVAVAQAIWTGIQVAGQAVLTALAWSVQALWSFAIMVHNGLKAAGRVLLTGAKKTLGLFKALYRDVLKPAWQKFWKFVDQVKDWLDKKFKPIFDLLMKWRKRILDFYGKWIRPILDVIGITRKVLRVLQTFGIDWARALDKKLAELERRIDEPFRRIIGEINRIIGIVNRIVTADGLFQRLALLRSVERDMAYISRSFWRLQSRQPTDEEKQRNRPTEEPKTPEEHAAELVRAIETGDAQLAVRADEWVADLRRLLNQRPRQI